MSKIITLEYIKIKTPKMAEGYECLATEYIDSKTKYNNKCGKGHIYKTCWSYFNSGIRCAECAGLKKLTLEYIKEQTSKMAEEYECLATEYINAKTKYNNKCKEGHVYKTCWNSFKTGYRCPICYGEGKLTLDFIKQKTKELAKGYRCKAKEYKNARTKMPFDCDKGHEFWMIWDSFRKGTRCPECWRLENLKKNHPNWRGGLSVSWYDTYVHQIDWIEEVQRDPENKDYLQIKCTNCDNWFSPTRRETEARIAAIYDRTKGENRFYCSEECKQSCSIFRQQIYPKGFIPENYGRSSQAEWAELIKERDDYTCIKCGKTDVPLVAHHIEGLNVNPIMSADIDLGITVCSECDKLIHSEVGCRPIDLRRDSLCP